MVSKQRTYDFTEGLQRAKERIDDDASDEIGNRAADRARRPREQSDAEKVVTAALAINVDDLKSEQDFLSAKKLVDEAMAALAQMIIVIRGQIDEATERKWRDDVYSDPGWWKRVNGAHRAKSWQRQQLQNKFGELNRKLKTFRHVTIEQPRWEERAKRRDRIFVQMAKLHLDLMTYERLWSLVTQFENATKENE